ncbi:MAG: hypothetical protein RL196_1183 [Actinomycetota bacterium]|jgi:uncharacterized protein with FMN-binding domain
MNRDQVNTLMTALAIGGSLAAGIVVTNHQVAENTLSFVTPDPTSSGTPTPTDTASGTPTPTQTQTTPVTKQGDLFVEQQWGGQIQLSVTKDGGTITNIGLDTATATGGRQGAFSYLVQEAMAANGSNIGNISGATYTTQVFKQALDSALSKF